MALRILKINLGNVMEITLHIIWDLRLLEVVHNAVHKYTDLAKHTNTSMFTTHLITISFSMINRENQ